MLALPAKRPAASRKVVWDDDEFDEVLAEPVKRPEASRYWVLEFPPNDGLLTEVPVIRPAASRMTERTVPFESV